MESLWSTHARGKPPPGSAGALSAWGIPEVGASSVLLLTRSWSRQVYPIDKHIDIGNVRVTSTACQGKSRYAILATGRAMTASPTGPLLSIDSPPRIGPS